LFLLSIIGVISSACTVSDVYTIENGAEQIPQKLVEVALAGNPSGAPKEFIHATVKKITRTDNDRLRLSYDLADNNKTEEGLFDYVILSLPLHQESNISTSDDIKLPSLRYHEMCRTFLSGQINYSLFDLPLSK
uniref:Prenylcys_lyase domain-containing protein n=1 Tax=Schistosoma curassoni TaxID=6186 RepID=A0A183JQ64_9TREM